MARSVTLQQTVELVRRRSPSPRRTCRCSPATTRTSCARSCCASAARSPSPRHGSTPARPRTAGRGTRRLEALVIDSLVQRLGGRRPAAQPAGRPGLARDRARSPPSSARAPGRRRRSSTLAAAHARTRALGVRRDGRRARRPARGRRRRGRATPTTSPRHAAAGVRRRPGRGRAAGRRRRRRRRGDPGGAERAAGRAGVARRAAAGAAPTPCCPSGRWPATRTPATQLVADVYRPLLARRRRRWSRPSRRSSTPAARSRPPPGRCSCTPTPSGTGCAGSPRCAARSRPTPRGALTLRVALALGRLGAPARDIADRTELTDNTTAVTRRHRRPCRNVEESYKAGSR